MQFFSKKISQVYLVLFVGAFLTLTGNFTFFEKTMQIYPFAENWLFVISLSLFLFSFLSSILLLICFRWSVKPILIFLLLLSSVLTYSTSNYGIVFDHNMITNTFETDASELGDLLSIQFILYLFFLGLLPSFFVLKIKIIRISGESSPKIPEIFSFKPSKPRVASLRRLYDLHKNVIDDAIVIFFPGPLSVTGEDIFEIHIHGSLFIEKKI